MAYAWPSYPIRPAEVIAVLNDDLVRLTNVERPVGEGDAVGVVQTASDGDDSSRSSGVSWIEQSHDPTIADQGGVQGAVWTDG